MAYSTISKPSLHFNTKLYTGNGSTQSITGVGFQPDFVWLKRRDASAGHKLNDAVRGVNKQLVSNNTNAEDSNTDILTAFGTDGFTLGNNSDVNNNGNSFVSWNWKAGTTGSGNTTGSGTAKTYNYSVNTTAGFSIINYVGNGTIGQQIPHHLGVTPQMIIQKNRDRTSNFLTYHHNNFASNGNKLNLNSTDATQTDTGTYNSAPTSTYVVIGNDAGMNTNDENHIMYCFAEKRGFSKFGTYTGNGNADGAFVYTGFKPAFTLIKRISSGDNWAMHDNRRPGRNPNDAVLRSNLADAEYGGSQGVDYLSNGFKARQNDGEFNNSGETYIFMAFAEEPLVANVGANGIPATAR
jgi:hypothetical protein